MLQHKNCITAETHAGDHYCLLLNKNTVCLWNTGSVKEIPKKYHNNKTYQTSYKKHIEGLKKAFEEGIFEVRYKEGIGFGVHTLSALSPKEKKDKKTVKLLWAEYQMCKSSGCKWSLVERCITIKKKVHPSKDDQKPNAE
eukprot:14195179-Ditylum_brightwellii.AAC.1